MKFSYQGKSTQVIGQVDALVSGISVSPDGKYVYVYGGDMNNLFSIKEDGSGVANLLGKISEKYGDISCGFPEFVRDVQGAYIGKIRVYCSDSSTYRYYIIFLNPDGTDIFAIDNVSYQIYSGGSKIVWEKDGYLYISDLREGASPTIADLNVLGSFRVLPSAGKILYQKGEQAPWSSSWWSSYSLLFTSLDGSTKGVIDTGVSGDYFTTPDESYVIYTKWVFEVQGSSLSVKRVLKSAKLK
ncbi:hypothetical protein HRbin19_00454 [bacterium HR19]|nr:hypothetical protein HRbin19_00454 [bacterium HR19]